MSDMTVYLVGIDCGEKWFYYNIYPTIELAKNGCTKLCDKAQKNSKNIIELDEFKANIFISTFTINPIDTEKGYPYTNELNNDYKYAGKMVEKLIKNV